MGGLVQTRAACWCRSGTSPAEYKAAYYRRKETPVALATLSRNELSRGTPLHIRNAPTALIWRHSHVTRLSRNPGRFTDDPH